MKQRKFKKRNRFPLYQGSVEESFLKFLPADELDAGILTYTILSCLEKFGIDYKSNLIGQGYDGAWAMSGNNSGVAARIKVICPIALYIHCYAQIKFGVSGYNKVCD